jgi:hypothetical protein
MPIIIEEKDKNRKFPIDSRLFWDEILYCEGLHKPYFRGKIHMTSLLVFPFAFLHLYNFTWSNSMATFAGFANLIANFICFATSAMYHGVSWPVKYEIFFQKLDHMAISIWCHCMMYPLVFLLFPLKFGIPFFVINTTACVLNCHNIYHSRPSIIIHSLVPGILAPFLPVCWYYFSVNAWRYCIGVIFFQLCGTIVFSMKKTPDFFNINFVSFHEIFHFFSLGSALFVYLTNLEIISYYLESCQNEVCLIKNV